MASDLTGTQIRAVRSDGIGGLEPGAKLGKFLIKRLLGRGGMAAVYLAEDTMLGVPVAIKVLLPEFATNLEMVERFKGEAKAAKRLSHQNIIRIYDIDEYQGLYYFSMEYVEGVTLSDMMMKKGKFSEQESLNIARQILLALVKGHSQTLAHRDIKPSNIMVKSTGEVVVTDYGIAKDWSKETRLTQMGVMVGTMAYASPEQKTGGKVDGRSDIYCLGAVMYEMATGKIPSKLNKSHDPFELPPPPGDLEANISNSYSNLVLKALEPKAEKRFATAEDMLQAIDRVLGGHSYRYTPSLPRRQKLFIAAGVGVFVLAGLLLFWNLGGREWALPYLSPAFNQAGAPQVDPADLAKAKELTAQGEAAADKGDFDQARKHWEKALKVVDGYPDARSKLTALEMRINLHHEREAQRLVAEAEQAANKREFERSKDLLNKALKLAPDYPPARDAIGQLPDRINTAKADDLLVQADEASRKGNFDKAEAAILEALKVKPDYPLAVTLQSRVQELRKQKQVDTLTTKGYDALTKKDYPNAIKLFQDALTIAPDNMLAKMGLEQAKSPTTVVVQSSTTTTRPARSVDVSRLIVQADTNAKAGKYNMAVSMLQMALSLDPNNAQAREKLREYQDRQ